jgi:hypothetical protein
MRDWVTCVEACVSVRQFVILFLGATKDSQSIGRNWKTFRKDIVNKSSNSENNNTIYA